MARVDVEADSLSSILGLVEDKVGYTILPFAPVHSLVAAGRLRLWRIEKTTMSRQLMLATSTSRPATAATRAAVDILREKVRAWEKGTSGREVAASQGP